MSLLEAIKICEEYVRNYKGSFGAIKNKYRFSSPVNEPFNCLELSHDPELFNSVITKLETLNLSSSALKYIKNLNSLEYAYYVFDKLTGCVVLTDEEIDSLRLIYSNLDIISKKDIPLFDNHRTRVNSINHAKSELTFSVANWKSIPSNEREARMDKITTIIEGRKE